MDAVTPIAGFDYLSLEEGTRVATRAAAERIRTRMKRTAEDIIEIGRDLATVKKAIGHGGFLKWIDAEFALSESAAQKMMAVAKQFGAKSVNVTDLTASVLYALAAPSTTDEVRARVGSLVEAGEKITVEDVKSLREEWSAERKALKKQIEDAKLTGREAKSIRNDVQQQLTDLQRELASLRDERDTLKHELEHAQSIADGPQTESVSFTERAGELDSVDGQIEILMADWNRVSPKAREEFLRRIDRPAIGVAA